MLTPLKDAFPRMQLVWGDSHYAGTFIEWLDIHLGWTMQPVRALTVPKRGLLVPEGEEVDWDKLFPKGFRPLPEMLGDRTQLFLDGAMATALSRP